MNNKPFSYRTLGVFFHDISIMITSGTAMEDILSVLSGDCAEEAFRPVLAAMRKSVAEGESLSGAMRKTEYFPDYAVNMTSAAEEAGKLEDVSTALSTYYYQRERTQRLISGALKRPLFLLFVVAVIMGGFIGAILPAMAALYNTLGGDASLYISGSYIIGGIAFGLIFIAMVAALIIWACSKTDKGQPFINKIWTQSRFTKNNALLFAEAQFVSDVDVRLSGGILLDRAFEQAAENIKHKAFRETAEKCTKRLFNGESLGEILLEEKLLPPVCTHMLFGALRSGESEKAFHKVSAMLFSDAEQQAEELIGRVEPVLTGFFTISVGLSLLSVMLPLIGIITAMG